MAAQAETGIVIAAFVVGLPEIQQGSGERLAGAGQHEANQFDRLPRHAGFNQLDPLGRRRLEEWPFGLRQPLRRRRGMRASGQAGPGRRCDRSRALNRPRRPLLQGPLLEVQRAASACRSWVPLPSPPSPWSETTAEIVSVLITNPLRARYPVMSQLEFWLTTPLLTSPNLSDAEPILNNARRP